jgi:hypothetical protein
MKIGQTRLIRVQWEATQKRYAAPQRRILRSCIWLAPNVGFGSRAAVAGRLMAQPVCPQLRNTRAFRHLRFVPEPSVMATQHFSRFARHSMILPFAIAVRP